MGIDVADAIGITQKFPRNVLSRKASRMMLLIIREGYSFLDFLGSG